MACILFGLITVQMPPLNAHDDKFSRARGLIVGVSLPLLILVCNNRKLWQDSVHDKAGPSHHCLWKKCVPKFHVLAHMCNSARISQCRTI